VSAVETEEGKRLAEVKIKQLTGGDTVTARFLFQEFFEFRPLFKLFLATNHKPEIRGTDHAIWRRIRLIPFDVTFAPSQQDKALTEKLRAELPGILAWAVQGCIQWQRDGLSLPDEVRTATAAYREEMDALAAFLADCCTIHPEAQVTANDLGTAYQSWCEANGEKPLKSIALGKRLRERGFTPTRSPRTRGWRGLGLLTDPTRQ
jgi:putative DNA primase/helicase